MGFLVISFLIPASNFENITDNMNAILGLKDKDKDKDKDKIIVLLKKKHEENYKLFSESLTLDNCLNDDELIYEKELIKNKNKNSGDFIRDLKSLIKIRNIICHENTIDLNEQKFHCEQSSEIVKKFIYLTEEIINDLEQKPNK